MEIGGILYGLLVLRIFLRRLFRPYGALQELCIFNGFRNRHGLLGRHVQSFCHFLQCWVSAHAVVREVLLDMQRDVAKQYNVIMDGRDIGTVVLPKADVKIFLTAEPEVRAKRRYDELIARGQKANLDTILKEIKQRDYQDTHREIAPLKMARDSIKLDTSNLDIDGVLAEMKRIIAQKIPV